METKFNSQICTSREQSERLLKLGLKKETADMCWIEEWGYDDDKRETFCTGNYFVRPIDYVWDDKYLDYIPAWSLHRLIDIVPSTINNMLWFTITPYTASYDSVDYIKSFDSKDNIYDNIVNCIEWLIKGGYFSEEYLGGRK